MFWSADRAHAMQTAVAGAMTIAPLAASRGVFMRRAVIAIACWLACGLAAGADEVARGEALIRARCVSCHDIGRLRTLAGRRPEAEREAKWQKFLPGHFVADSGDRDLIIAWLHVNAGK